jgi:hypothetical protein
MMPRGQWSDRYDGAQGHARRIGGAQSVSEHAKHMSDVSQGFIQVRMRSQRVGWSQDIYCGLLVLFCELEAQVDLSTSTPSGR